MSDNDDSKVDSNVRSLPAPDATNTTEHLQKLDELIALMMAKASSYGDPNAAVAAAEVAERALGQKAAIMGLFPHD